MAISWPDQNSRQYTAGNLAMLEERVLLGFLLTFSVLHGGTVLAQESGQFVVIM